MDDKQRQAVKDYYIKTGCSVAMLASVFNISHSMAKALSDQALMEYMRTKHDPPPTIK